MTVTKINGFRAPYRSSTFQEQADALSQTNGIVTMEGVVSENGSNVVIPPYTFIQNGLIVQVGTEKTVAKPSMEAPYYVTVSAPTGNPVDDLSYQFAKAPTDISSNEVVISAYDGQEWRMFPFISLKGVYAQLKQDRVDFGATGPVTGLITTENGPDYETSGGTLVDPVGEVKVLEESRLFPQVGDDPDWGRVDRIVYRRALDAEKRIGERTFLLGGTYDSSPASLYETASHDSSAGREKIKTVIASDNTAHMFVASGYGNNWQIVYSKWSSDRQTEVVAPVSVATASSKHFDVVIDENDEIHLIYILDGDVYWEKVDDAGAVVGGPTQIDTQTNDCDYPTAAIDPHNTKLFTTWSSLISTDQNNLFFKTLSLGGLTVTEAKQLTTGTTNHIRPHLHVTEDLWVYLAWEEKVTTSIWYTILDDIGDEIQAAGSVSGATERIGVGTLVDAASHPRIAVSDNKNVYVTFLQDKGGAAYGISVWKDGSAFMQELVDPSESFEHYGFFLDSTFNGLHFILARSGNIDYAKLEEQEVVFTIALQSAGASGTHTVMDKFGSMFHSWTEPFSGTYTNYDTGLLFTKTGPQVVNGILNDVTLQDTDMLLDSILPSQPPVKGDRVVVSGSSGGLNDGTYYIDSVLLVSLDAVDDYYHITMTTSFPALEVGAPTADFGVPDGNGAYFEKSTSETNSRAFRKSVLPSDILLARIVRPGPGILNYYNFSPALGPDFILPHGTEVSIDWSLTATDNLTISGGLNIYDMLNVTNYVVDDGSYPMNEGDALYVILDPDLATITPQISPLNSLPFSDEMRVLGAVINGYFNPFLLSIGGMGVLDPNEQVILGEDVPQELRSKIGFISETEIELYPYTKGTDQLDTYPQFMGETNLIAGQNTHVRMIKGQVSWVKPNADELVFLSEAFLQIPEIAESRNRIAPQTVTLDADGKVAWVRMNRLTGAAADLTVNVSAIGDVDLDGSTNRDVFILARRTGSDLIINGSRLLPGSSKDLDSDLTIENKTLLGSGVTEATSEPTYSTRGAPQRNLDDSQGILDALTSVDVELDKFFGQLRIVPHDSDADKVIVTGVDLTMKDGSVLSQEISSLLMKFEGAVIDFTTGEIFEDDGLTPLGVDFTPTTLLDTEVAWYSIAIVSSGTDANNAMGVQFLVLPGDAAADEASAEYPPFGGQKKIGMVLVTNNGGNIELAKIRQLGVGSGSGGGGGGGTAGKLIEGGDWSLAALPPVETQVFDRVGTTFNSSSFPSANRRYAVQIIPTASGGFSKSSFWVKKEGVGTISDVLTAYLYSDSGDNPDTLLATSTNTVDETGISTTFVEREFTFDGSVPVVAGQKYWVMVRISGSDFSPRFEIRGATDIPGILGRWSDDGSVWNNLSALSGMDYALVDQGAGLAWSADAYVSLPGITNERNTIQADSLTLEDGQAAYVLINQLAGGATNLTPQVDNIEDIFQYDPNLFIFARGVSDGVVIGNSFKLIFGQSKELDAGMSIENRALLGSGVTEATSDPDYSGRGAPLRTIADSEKMLEAMSSMDVEIDKFFGQLRIIPDTVDLYKAAITGVDKTMKDGAVLSQEVANLVMEFDGATIDFSTGDIDTVGSDFTPASIGAGQYCWYSLALVANAQQADGRMTINMIVSAGTPGTELGSTLPAFAGSVKVGQVQIFNNGGSLEIHKVRQLGVGSGSGGGGGGGTAGKLIEGGNWDVDGTTLTWSADAYVSLPGLANERNTLQAGNATIADGQAAYAVLNPLPGAAANITPAVADIDSISPYTPNLYIFAWNKGGNVYVGGGGNALTSGKTKKLDVSGNADKQDKNLKLIKGGEWKVTQPSGSVEDEVTATTAPTDYAELHGGGEVYEKGEEFTPSVSGEVISAKAYLFTGFGTPNVNVVAKIYSLSGGLPDTLLGQSDNYHSSNLTGSYEEHELTFSTPVSVNSGTEYALVFTLDANPVSGVVRIQMESSFQDNSHLFKNGSNPWGTLSKDVIGLSVGISFPSSPVLSWSADAFVQIEGMVNTRNRIVAGSQAIADGAVIYVNVNREPGADDDLTINVDAIEDIADNNLDALIIARRVGDEVYVGTGTTKLKLEESTELDRAKLLVTKAKLVEGGDWSNVAGFVPADTQEQTLSPAGLTSLQASNHRAAQSFTPAASGKISSVDIYLEKDGAPDSDCVVELMTMSGGVPSAVLASVTVNLSTITWDADNTFTFDVPYDGIVAGTQYAISFRYINVVLIDVSNRVRFQGSQVEDYTGGDFFTYISSYVIRPNWDARFSVDIEALVNTLAWSADAYVSLPGLANVRNTIPAGNAALSDGQAAYVPLNTLAGASANLTPVIADIDAVSHLDQNVFILARNIGGNVHFGNDVLADGKTKRLDVAGNADKQDKNLKLIGGGDWNLSAAGTLSWSADAYIQIEGMVNARNRIATGSQAIADGEVIYVNVNREPGDPDALTPAAIAIESLPDTNLDAFIIARRVGDELYLGAGGNRMALGDTAVLDKPEGGDPSFNVKSFSDPNLSIKGGYLRTDDGFILATGSGTDRDTVAVDITIDLDAVFDGTPVNDTTYYLYVDRDKLGAAVTLTDSGDDIYNVVEAQYTISDKPPNQVSPYRLMHVQTLRYGTGEWTGVWDAPRFLPDSVGGFFDTIEKWGTTITSATSQAYAHTLSGKPGLYTLEYFDGSDEYPLDNSSHIAAVDESSITIDTSTLTFGGGEYVKVVAYFYPTPSMASISNSFATGWFEDTATTQFAHNMIDAQDIRDYAVQEWDVTAGKWRNINPSGLVVDYDDVNFYLDWTGLSPSSTLRYRVVGGRTNPVASVPVRYGGYTQFVGFGPGSHATLADAINASAPGDAILVGRSEVITSPVDININDIKVEFMPGAVVKVTGGTADGIIVSGSRVDLLGLSLEGDQNAAMTNLLRVSGDDNQVERARIHVNDSNLTVTNAVNLEGDRNYATASVRVTVGALTNSVVDSGTDNDYSVRG